MIFLPFILISSAHATGQYNVPQKPITYCTELLPQVLQGGTGSARPVSIEVSSKCAEKFSLSEVCVVSVKCALMPPLVAYPLGLLKAKSRLRSYRKKSLS